MAEDRLRELAEREYRDLCTQLRLAPVSTFALFVRVEGSTDVVATFTRPDGSTGRILRSEGASGFRPGLMFISLEPRDAEVPDEPPRFPPPIWSSLADQFYLVDLMDRVIEGENCSAAEAAKRVFARHGAELAKSARSIDNDYSRFKRYYDLWRGPKYVPGQQLTRERWSR